MNRVQMLSLSLAVVLVGPVHAQSCSGGDGGGIDATGNQCSTPTNVVVSAAHPSFWDRYRATDSLGKDVGPVVYADGRHSAGEQDGASGCAGQGAREDGQGPDRVGSALFRRRVRRNGCQRQSVRGSTGAGGK